MTELLPSDSSPETPRPEPRRRTLTTRTALIGAALLGLGIAGGATAVMTHTPSVEMAPVSPVAIATLKDDDGVVSVRGRVAEIYGPMFVLADGNGRALVEAGRQVDGTGLIGLGNAVTVQGRFRHGVLRASFLVTADGKVTALHPFGPHGPGGPEGPGGPRGFRHGPGGAGPGGEGPGGEGPEGMDAPPPAPPAVAPAVASPQKN